MVNQADLFDGTFAATSSMLARLITQSRLYEHTEDFRDLLEFAARLPNMAPFNAMILHIQNPGLRFAASAHEWKERTNRTIRDGARPLVVLVPFGPVGFVYSLEDTEGPPLPDAAAQAFRATGLIDRDATTRMWACLVKKGITVSEIKAGEGHAGHIRRNKVTGVGGAKSARQQDVNKFMYKIALNGRHAPAVQFATVVHELAHVALGHLGPDDALQVPNRRTSSEQQQEIEAESVSFVVCKRNGIASHTESYLHGYVNHQTNVKDLDVYAIMKAAGQVEVWLGIATRDAFEPKSGAPGKHGRHAIAAPLHGR